MRFSRLKHIFRHTSNLLLTNVLFVCLFVLNTNYRDEEREKPLAELCAKSITSSDDSTRRRTSSSNDSVLSESAASGYSSPPLADVPWPPNSGGVSTSERNSVSSSSPHHHRAVADAPAHEVLETTV